MHTKFDKFISQIMYCKVYSAKFEKATIRHIYNTILLSNLRVGYSINF